ncbi:MAG: 16S rRNA (cytosine(1402)-N(4))-methyltransferase RsmH [Deltaproteobacteria bacterium]|nr:MAG: 16S rRNA (cytosine(1402)-N(4))-methyltransferase RsmH [Deltaproteobacteria bacterium]
MPYFHIPIMLAEVVHYLNCRPGKTYIDCTLGGAGHARTICDKILPRGILIGIDQDKDAIRNAKRSLKSYEPNVYLVHDNFINLPEIISQYHIRAADGILLDLGLSLHQLESSNRGFSFRKDEPLDMRMNTDKKLKAADIVNAESEENLKKIFKDYGEERWSRRIARKIVQIRKHEKIFSSRQLASIVCNAVPKEAFKQKIHPATRVFMALRIAVNRELDNLESFMPSALACLNPGGRLCVLSFHSLEDRIVKKQMKAWEKGCTCPPDFPDCVCGQKPLVRILTKKVVRPKEKEIEINPMARSTKLRAAEKL